MVKQQSNMMVINVIWPGIVAGLLLASAAKAEGKPLVAGRKKFVAHLSELISNQ